MFGIGFPELIIIIIMLIILGIPGTIGARLAKSKGRNAVGWFILSAFFWLPILIVILLPPVKEVSGKYRECPACKEFVKWRASVCKNCGTALSPLPEA